MNLTPLCNQTLKSTMAILLEMVCGQGERQRRELQELRAALVSSRNQEPSGTVPGDISPDMLAG